MNHQDALARQRSLRDGQTARARLVEGAELDRAAMTEVATTDGVPPRFASLIKADLIAGSVPHKVADSAIAEMVTPNQDHDGLYVLERTTHHAGRMAGVLYSAAMVRGRAARWYNFAEMASNFTRRIQLDKNSEWDVGEITDWNVDLDSAWYCYDLVVVHNVQASLVTPFIGTELYKMLSARAVRGLYTVVTGQLKSMEEMWNDAPAIKQLIDDQFAFYPEGRDAGE